MLYGDRIWQFLPGFLKQTTGILSDICRAIGEALDTAITTGEKLKAQGMANRLVGFDEYYGSDERKADLNLLGASRFVFKRSIESWDSFESRLQQFPDDARWFGTKKGITTEIGRTGLTIDSISEMRDDPQRFILLSLADQCGIPEDQISHVFALGEEEETVRGDRIFAVDECEGFVFLIYLSGATAYSKKEVAGVLKMVKPPYTKGYLFYPNEVVAEEVV